MGILNDFLVLNWLFKKQNTFVFSTFKHLFGEYVMALKWDNIVQEIHLKVNLYTRWSNSGIVSTKSVFVSNDKRSYYIRRIATQN